MPIILDGTAGIDNDATDLSYTGTLTGGTGVVNLGSGQVYKDASGNVGIGTSSPQTRLHLGSAAGATVFRIGNAGTPYAEVYSDQNGVMLLDADAGNTGASTNFRIRVGGTERMRITSAGSVGIGTSSPTQRLDVAGTVNATEYRKNTVAISSITYQDITISGLTTSFQTFLLSLPSGVSFTSVVTITPVNGVNDILYISEIALGEWSGVQTTTQVRLTARLGNAVASNQGTARVYYRI